MHKLKLWFKRLHIEQCYFARRLFCHRLIDVVSDKLRWLGEPTESV